MYYDFIQPFSNSLYELIESNDTTIEDLLNEETCVRAFRQGVANLVTFFVDRADELLRLCLSPERTRINGSAYSIIACENGKLIDVFIEKDLLSKYSREIFTENQQSYVISRFAYITQMCCLKKPEIIGYNVQYLKLFIPYCDNRIVQIMFESLTNDGAVSLDIPEQLIEVGIVDAVLQALQEMMTDGSIPEEKESIICGLFYIVQLFLQTHEIRNYLSTPQTIVIITKDIGDAPVSVLNAQWETITLFPMMVDEEGYQQCVNAAVQILTDFSNGFHAFHGHALDFLSNSIDYNAEYLIEVGIGNILYNILDMYSTHTIAHRHVTNFVIASLPSDELTDHIFVVLLPAITAQIKDRSNIILHATCWDLLQMLDKKSEIYPHVQKLVEATPFYDQECRDSMQDITDLLEQEYGGPLPQQVDFDESDNAATHEQLQHLIRILMQRK